MAETLTFLGTAEVAERLGVSARTVRRWLQQHKLPSSPLRPDRGKWRLSLEDLARRLLQQQAEREEEREARGD